MTALRMLTDLRDRGVRLWDKFSTRKNVLEILEMLDRHETDTADHLAAPASAEANPIETKTRRSSSLRDQAIALSSVPNWRREEQDSYTRFVAPYKGFVSQRLALDKKFVRGEGCHLFDAEGNRYADFIANFGALPFGHDPHAIWEAIEKLRGESRPNLVMPSSSEPAGELAEKLLALAPAGLGHVTFTNSGAEAIEAAIKLARCRTGRNGILSTQGGFHGHTLAGMSATGDEFFQRGFGAPAGGFEHIPFGDLDALQAALEGQPDVFAAFLVEPIQAESGVHLVPEGYLAAASDLCRRHGVLLVVDEVQTGLGRTGTLFTCEAEGVTPDILTLGSGLGGGLISIGACLYTPAVYSEDFELRHASYYAENALACRAALATVTELTNNERQMVRNVAVVGNRLRQQLRELQSEFPSLITDVRGRGLMLAIELDLDQVANAQTGMLAILQRHDLLLFMGASYLLNVEHIRVAPSFRDGNVLRIEPPLVADAAVCDRLIEALRKFCDILQRGDAGELLAHFMKRGRASASLNEQKHQHVPQPALAPRARAQSGCNRFGYVVHLLGTGDLRRFDPSLEFL